MIDKLEIENFKSIKDLKLAPRRINIFIGEPNSGKSNILETLAFFSFGGHAEYPGHLKDYIRLEDASNLFFDHDIEQRVRINAGNVVLEFKFTSNEFTAEWSGTEESPPFTVIFNYDLHGGTGHFQGAKSLTAFKFYKYNPHVQFLNSQVTFLQPYHGQNLMNILLTHGAIKKSIVELFKPFKLRLGFKPQDNKLEIIKQYEDIFISHPYGLISDTLRRLVFYLTAIYSNTDSVLIFEEPESKAFPYYTKHLAEIMARDKNSNQYFISTHNPYFLLSIIEKAHKEDVAVFLTSMDNYQTKVKELSEEDLEFVMEKEIDIFFNLDQMLKNR